MIVPVIGLVIWGLNTFWLHRLKKGDMDYSPEGFRKKGPDLRHNIGSGASGSAAAGGPASLEPALTTLFPATVNQAAPFRAAWFSDPLGMSGSGTEWLPPCPRKSAALGCGGDPVIPSKYRYSGTGWPLPDAPA